EARRLEGLTTDLLAFAKSGAIERRQVDPVRLLRDAADLAGAGRVDVDVGASPHSAMVDGPKLVQVLSNVIENAVHASQDSTRVEASVRHEGRRLVYRVRD